MQRFRFRVAVPACLAMVLAGCAGFSPDGGFGDVKTLTDGRVAKDLRWIRSDADAESVREAVRKLLETPLSADAAVQIALLNNRGLQAAYGDLGIAESDLVQAGRLRNPLFSFARLRRGDETEIERVLAFDLFGLLALPARTEIAAARFERVKLDTAATVVGVAAQARRAYYATLAADETVKYMQQARDAAEASAELARRMLAAGNFSQLDQAREQMFHAEVSANLARARQHALVERERLTRLLGLSGEEGRLRLPERLPELPAAARELTEVEQTALRERLDVLAGVRETELLAKSLGYTRATRFVDVLELGYQRTNETNRPLKHGFELELRLPLFDWGEASTRRAEHTYMQALHRVAETAVNARSEARAAYAGYRATYELARQYRDEIVPLRKRISEEMLLRYNGMLVSVFELLADARSQVAAVNAYIEALRDFWLADADLQQALTGTAPAPAAMAKTRESLLSPAGGGH